MALWDISKVCSEVNLLIMLSEVSEDTRENYCSTLKAYAVD